MSPLGRRPPPTSMDSLNIIIYCVVLVVLLTGFSPNEAPLSPLLSPLIPLSLSPLPTAIHGQPHTTATHSQPHTTATHSQPHTTATHSQPHTTATHSQPHTTATHGDPHTTAAHRKTSNLISNACSSHNFQCG